MMQQCWGLLKEDLFYWLFCLIALCLPWTYSVEQESFIGAYYSLEDILNVFNKEQYREDPACKKAVHLYHALVEDVGNTSLYEKTNPFIVIEGNHKTRKFVVARQLARALRATNLRNPPEFMNFLKFSFKEIETRRAYYSLALYASALEAQRILHGRPVVTAGYWLDIAAFSLAKKYPTEFPNNNSTEMQWPKDLFRPDIIFYINSPQQTLPQVEGGSTRAPNLLKPRLVDVYRAWTHPRVVELGEKMYSYNEMFTEMFRHINYIKQSKFKQYLKKSRKSL